MDRAQSSGGGELSTGLATRWAAAMLMLYEYFYEQRRARGHFYSVLLPPRLMSSG